MDLDNPEAIVNPHDLTERFLPVKQAYDVVPVDGLPVLVCPARGLHEDDFTSHVGMDNQFFIPTIDGGILAISVFHPPDDAVHLALLLMPGTVEECVHGLLLYFLTARA